MLMTSATHSDVTLANFHIVAEKRSRIPKNARNTAIANQINAWTESVLMGEKMTCVTQMMTAILDVAHLVCLSVNVNIKLSTVRVAFETTIARLDIACFLPALIIVTVHIASMTTTAFKVRRVLGARMVENVRRTTAAPFGTGWNAQNNVRGSRK